MTLKLIPNYHIPAHISAVFNAVRDLPNVSPNFESMDIIIDQIFAIIIAGSSEFSIHAAYICTDHHHVRISNDEPISYPDRKYNSKCLRRKNHAQLASCPINIPLSLWALYRERYKPNCSSIASFDSEIQRVFIRHC